MSSSNTPVPIPAQPHTIDLVPDVLEREFQGAAEASDELTTPGDCQTFVRSLALKALPVVSRSHILRNQADRPGWKSDELQRPVPGRRRCE